MGGVTSIPLLDRLRALGWRLTPQRRVIAEVMGGDHVHLTAEEVLERARGCTTRSTSWFRWARFSKWMLVGGLLGTTPIRRTVITTSCASNAVNYAMCILRDWTRSSCHARSALGTGSSIKKCSFRATAATAAGRRRCMPRAAKPLGRYSPPPDWLTKTPARIWLARSCHGDATAFTDSSGRAYMCTDGALPRWSNMNG